MSRERESWGILCCGEATWISNVTTIRKESSRMKTRETNCVSWYFEKWRPIYTERPINVIWQRSRENVTNPCASSVCLVWEKSMKSKPEAAEMRIRGVCMYIYSHDEGRRNLPRPKAMFLMNDFSCMKRSLREANRKRINFKWSWKYYHWNTKSII